MKNFYNSFSFVIAFMILCLTFNILLGSKFLEMFLLLVLLSMLVTNADKIQYLFKGIQKEG